MEEHKSQNGSETVEKTRETAVSTMSKNALKKLKKQQMWEVKKAEKKAQIKEQKRQQAEQKRLEWQQTLANLTEEERNNLIETRKNTRNQRMQKRNEEKQLKIQKLTNAKLHGQNIIVDLDFAHLMASNEIHSLVQQIMYCYAVNARCDSPAHLWLTGCGGEMGEQLRRIPGFDNWIIEKESRSYIEALEEEKERLVYLTADSETVLDELEKDKFYIVGGLVDRNRWKGITMSKANEQGIKTAKLPIGNFLKMSSSQVLTVNQVVEILLKFLETKDWKDAFFQVIPQRKRCGDDAEEKHEDWGENEETDEQSERKKQCVEAPIHD